MGTPFIFLAQPCPVCGAETQNRYLKNKSFVVENAEADGHAAGYAWPDPDHRGIRPQDYLIWICRECGFAAPHEVFRHDDQRGANFDLLKEKHLKLSRSVGDTVVRAIMQNLDYKDIVLSPRDALLAHVLSIRIFEQLPRDMRDHERLGRLNLRLGWLYREIMTGQAEVPSETVDVLQGLRRMWDSLPMDETACMHAAIACFEETLKAARKGDRSRNLKLLSLLGSLNQRVGNRDKALAYARRIHDFDGGSSARLREGLDLLVSKKGFTADERAAISMELEWLLNFIEDFAESRREVIENLVAKEMPLLSRLIQDEGRKLSSRVFDSMHEKDKQKSDLAAAAQARPAEETPARAEKGRGGLWGLLDKLRGVAKK
jgi:uncharacterized protein (DUF2225 family)